MYHSPSVGRSPRLGGAARLWRKLTIGFATTVAILAAAPAGALGAPALSEERFDANFNWTGLGDPRVGDLRVAGECSSSGNSTFHFTATGPADGPYPGTFTQTGIVTMGPPGSGTSEEGGRALLDVQVEFAVDAGSERVTGSGTLASPHGGANCSHDEGLLFSTAGAFVRYTARIDSGNGVYSDVGRAQANYYFLDRADPTQRTEHFHAFFDSDDPLNTARAMDGTAPKVSATNDGRSYLLGSAAIADFECTDEDGGSGLASCEGTIADGAALDTGSVGSKSFRVRAADNAGNVAERAVGYSVIYDYAGFFAPVANLPEMNPIRSGSFVPVKFSLGGDRGREVLAEDHPRSHRIACDTGLAIDGTSTRSSGALIYVPQYRQYVYLWETLRSWSGTCRQFVLGLNDGSRQRANFRFEAEQVAKAN